MVDDVVGLTPGQVAERHFELLLDGTSIRGEEIIEALRDYLVKGVPLTEAWKKHDLNPSQFYRRLKVIQTESTRAHALSAYYQSSAEGHHVPRIRSKVAAEAVKSAESKAAPKPSKAAPKASKAAPKAATKTAAKATETAKGRKAAD